MSEMNGKKSMGSRWDAIIGFFSPERGAKRRAWRAIQQWSTNSYRAARHTRIGQNRPTAASADYHLEAGWDRTELVDRARQIERDNPIADGLLTRSVENVIGCGIRAQVRSEDAEFNKMAKDLWDDWCYDSDVRGLDSFYELQALVFRSLLRDGDVGTILLSDGQLQAIESDQIAAPPEKRQQRNHIDGIDLDHRGKPKNYYVVTNEDDHYIIPRRRDRAHRKIIPAEDMIFLARRKRLGQTRGEPCFSQTFELFDQIDGLIEAVIVSARMGACFGLLLESPHIPSGLPTVEGAGGKTHYNWSMEPGMIKRLEPGESVKQVSPQHPSQNFSEFLSTTGRLLGLQLGLPLELIFMDFSKTNYSSARASLLQAYQAFRCHQAYIKNHWCKPIYRWKISQWVADGQLPDIPTKFRHSWISPGWQWVDPVKEIQAAQMGIDAGLTTMSDIAMGQGKDLVELLETRQRELELMREKNIPIIRSTATRDPDQEIARVAGMPIE